MASSSSAALFLTSEKHLFLGSSLFSLSALRCFFLVSHFSLVSVSYSVHWGHVRRPSSVFLSTLSGACVLHQITLLDLGKDTLKFKTSTIQINMQKVCIKYCKSRTSSKRLKEKHPHNKIWFIYISKHLKLETEIQKWHDQNHKGFFQLCYSEKTSQGPVSQKHVK